MWFSRAARAPAAGSEFRRRAARPLAAGSGFRVQSSGLRARRDGTLPSALPCMHQPPQRRTEVAPRLRVRRAARPLAAGSGLRVQSSEFRVQSPQECAAYFRHAVVSVIISRSRPKCNCYFLPRLWSTLWKSCGLPGDRLWKSCGKHRLYKIHFQKIAICKGEIDPFRDVFFCFRCKGREDPAGKPGNCGETPAAAGPIFGGKPKKILRISVIIRSIIMRFPRAFWLDF